jgi:hypothetical protein
MKSEEDYDLKANGKRYKTCRACLAKIREPKPIVPFVAKTYISDIPKDTKLKCAKCNYMLDLEQFSVRKNGTVCRRCKRCNMMGANARDASILKRTVQL